MYHRVKLKYILPPNESQHMQCPKSNVITGHDHNLKNDDVLKNDDNLKNEDDEENVTLYRQYTARA